MPELPEVQNFANELHKKYAGLHLKGIKFHRENLRYPFQKKNFLKFFQKVAYLNAAFEKVSNLCLRQQRVP